MPTMRLVGRGPSTGRASPAAAAGEPDALLATKLHLPGVRPGDNDPARFWRYVAAALERARPGLGEPLAARAGSSEAVVTALVNQLAAGDVAWVARLIERLFAVRA